MVVWADAPCVADRRQAAQSIAGRPQTWSGARPPSTVEPTTVHNLLPSLTTRLAPEVRAVRQWRVRDVMNANVVTATDDAPFGEIIGILAHHQISGVPIVNDFDRVVGVVTQADLLPQIEAAAPTNGRRGLRRGPPAPPKATARVARDLMTAPALTITPDASLATAAKLMHSKRL